jgi:hypothetical protein
MKASQDFNQHDLDRLFAEYREACDVPEPSVNFMPALWERIDAGQSWTKHVWKWANGFVAAAAAASLFLVMLQMLPRHSSDFYAATYVETLADHDDDQAIGELARVSVPDQPRTQEMPQR